MATVSSIDNQAPLFRSENDITSTDGNAATAFSQWLDDEYIIDDNSTRLEYNEAFDRENNDAYDMDRLDDELQTSEANDSEEKPRVKLFRDPEPPQRSAQESAGHSSNQTDGTANNNGVEASRDSQRTHAANTSTASQQNAAAAEITATKAMHNSKAMHSSQAKKSMLPPTNIRNDQATTRHTKESAPAKQTQKVAVQASKQSPIAKSGVPALDRLQDLNALKQLKTNIKAIFNGLKPLESSASKDAAVRQGEPLKGNVRLVSVDNVKPIRLTTLPVEEPRLEASLKTTLQHLSARKAVKLDASSTEATIVRDFKGYSKADTPATDPKNQAINGDASKADPAKAGRTNKKAPTLRNNILFDDESAINKRTSRAKGRRKGARQISKNSQPYAQAPGTPLFGGSGNPQATNDTNAIKENSWLQTAAQANIRQDKMEADSASAESKQNNLFSKSNTTAQASEAKQASKSAPAYATRSLSWLKSLADRTSFMNRSDPNWKVLEMKLDKGDGNMVIKVMREDDVVSVTVQFSDDNLRAQAESQTTQILESLREQYGRDVMFSFEKREDSAYEALSGEGSRRQNQTRKQADEPEKTIPVRHFDPLSPDQHIWIG